jgi:hypothetical protein
MKNIENIETLKDIKNINIVNIDYTETFIFFGISFFILLISFFTIYNLFIKETYTKEIPESEIEKSKRILLSLNLNYNSSNITKDDLYTFSIYGKLLNNEKNYEIFNEILSKIEPYKYRSLEKDKIIIEQKIINDIKLYIKEVCDND